MNRFLFLAVLVGVFVLPAAVVSQNRTEVPATEAGIPAIYPGGPSALQNDLARAVAAEIVRRAENAHRWEACPPGAVPGMGPRMSAAELRNAVGGWLIEADPAPLVVAAFVLSDKGWAAEVEIWQTPDRELGEIVQAVLPRLRWVPSGTLQKEEALPSLDGKSVVKMIVRDMQASLEAILKQRMQEEAKADGKGIAE